MLDLSQYASLGAALRAAMERWPEETCLIEADRDRERRRLTYRQFQDEAMRLARAMQEAGFPVGCRTAIVMSNQPNWLLTAYAALYSGGVLVPLDYKLSRAEHLELVKHSGTQVLVTEYHLWRAMMSAPAFQNFRACAVLVTDAPEGADLGKALRWERARRDGEPAFVPRSREDMAAIVYSSGTGGRPKGCVLTHANYLEQCASLTSLYPFWPGVRYLSILPTNHAIDFMVGFIGPFVCGAAVVHLRTLRPEYVRDAFTRYQITYMSLVPMVLKNLERGLRERFAALPSHKKILLDGLIAINRSLTRNKPNVNLSRLLLGGVHQAFGGELRGLFVGGAFTEPSTLQFFYDLGIPVANGYGLTEAGTAITLNDFKPFRADTVGKPLPGMEMRIVDPDAESIGEVAVRGSTVMSHYLNDPEMTAESIVDGWLLTGDLGRTDGDGHLQLFGRKKNMIVTEGGKNVYPEDIETVFEGLSVKEFCVFAGNYLWPRPANGPRAAERLVMVLRLEPGKEFTKELVSDLSTRNGRLPGYKRISGFLVWEEDFPRTASLKIKRPVLAEQIRASRASESAVVEL